MSEQEKVQVPLLPFHITIVDTIRQCQGEHELLNLCSLIRGTKIPKGHDEIMFALFYAAIEFCPESLKDEITKAVHSLSVQKVDMHNANLGGNEKEMPA